MIKERFTFWLFLLSSALFLWLFYFFLKPFVVASLLVLSTYLFAERLEGRLSTFRYTIVHQNRELLSASFLTVLLGVLMFGPIAYAIVYMLGDISSYNFSDVAALKIKLYDMAQSSDFLGEYLKTKTVEGLDLLFSEQFWADRAKSIFAGMGGILQGVASSLAELALVVVFFFLLHWFKRDIIVFIKTLLPMDDSAKESLAREVVGAISVVFLTLLGIMIAQGAAFFVLMLFFDYNAPILGFFCAISSVVPIFGTALVWVPVAASEFLKGNIISAAVISFYSWFVMAFLIDNFLRLFLLNKVSKLLRIDYKINEFLLFFSIAAGIAVFGFWGFIIGPSITALFLSSARAYKKTDI